MVSTPGPGSVGGRDGLPSPLFRQERSSLPRCSDRDSLPSPAVQTGTVFPPHCSDRDGLPSPLFRQGRSSLPAIQTRTVFPPRYSDRDGLHSPLFRQGRSSLPAVQTGTVSPPPLPPPAVQTGTVFPPPLFRQGRSSLPRCSDRDGHLKTVTVLFIAVTIASRSFRLNSFLEMCKLSFSVLIILQAKNNSQLSKLISAPVPVLRTSFPGQSSQVSLAGKASHRQADIQSDAARAVSARLHGVLWVGGLSKHGWG